MNKVEWRSIFFLFVFLPLSLQLSRATINRLRELRLVAPIHSNSNQNSKKVKSTTSFFFDDSLFMFYFLYLFSCSSFLGWFFLSLEVEFLLSSGRVATLLSPSAVIVRTFFLVCDSFQAIRRITATWLSLWLFLTPDKMGTVAFCFTIVFSPFSRDLLWFLFTKSSFFKSQIGAMREC